MKGLKIARAIKNLNQSQLAEMLGMNNYQSISRWEKGKQFPTHDKLIKLSELLECSIDFLVKGEE